MFRMNPEDVQNELTSSVLDNSTRYVEVIIDQDVRLGLVDTVPKKQEETGPPKSDFRTKDVNSARLKLDEAIANEAHAEDNLARFNELQNENIERGSYDKI